MGETTSDAGTGPEAGSEASAYGQMGMEAMLDLAAPQPNYKRLIEEGGYVCPMEGVGLSFNRSNTEFVLRNHQLFSSEVEMNLGNVRPLIPLIVVPPNHSKYR